MSNSTVKTKLYSQHPEAIASRKRKAAFTDEQKQKEAAYQLQYRLTHGYQSAEYRATHRINVLKQVAAFRVVVTERRRILREYKSHHGCMDCGNTNPIVLDFDHRDRAQKVAGVCRMVTANSMKKVWAEVAKCDVVCRNCHSIRTFRQMRWAI
jgi:hypothetical protein